MNKYELKYLFEQEATKVENLIDVVGKNAHHIQDLSAELKKKDANIDKLIARYNCCSKQLCNTTRSRS